MDTLLKESDFVSVHLKVTDETRGMFDKEAFEKMKDSAFFINCARAAIMNESDLIEALRNKTIAGAAVDVFEKEPVWIEHPYITELDNIVMTPHIAGATYDVLSNHTLMIIQELERFTAGEPLLYEFR
jgi:D-3-phosphoglycerate dehydrogenase